ncbi:MAG TPA: hypothetical protein VKT53_03535 [Candidatus Acidoferrum sp.]|nr:hypothetical protein [Candidatus Acidoferrum sp.]
MKRPWPILVFGILFIVVGAVGFASHLTERPFERYIILISGVSLLAVVGGIFLLLGHNWARWLVLAWLAFHVFISAFDSFEKCAVHVAFLLIIGYCLLRPSTSLYFRGGTSS